MDFPIWLRRYYIQKINDKHKEENEHYEKARKGQGNRDTSKMNVDPSEWMQNAKNMSRTNSQRIPSATIPKK